MNQALWSLVWHIWRLTRNAFLTLKVDIFLIYPDVKSKLFYIKDIFTYIKIVETILNVKIDPECNLFLHKG